MKPQAAEVVVVLVAAASAFLLSLRQVPELLQS